MGVLLCDRGIEYLGHRIDNVAVLYRHENGGAQILITLDVRGHSYLMYYLCHLRFHIASLKHTARGGVTLRGEVCDLFGQIGRVDGFHHYVVRACPCQVGEHRRCHCLGYNEECGRGIAAVAEHLAAPYQLCTVKSGQPCIDDGNVGVDSSDLLRASSPSRASAITEYPNAQRRSRQLRRNSSFGSAISMLVFCSIMFPFLSSERSRIGSVRAVYSDAARRRAANYRVRTSVITAIFYHKMEYYSMHELEKYYTMFLLNFVNYIQ